MTKEEIIELIKQMISEWDSVKTWAGVCKRNALQELLQNILSKDNEKFILSGQLKK